MNFLTLKDHLQANFNIIQNSTYLYKVNISGDYLWKVYLDSFDDPEIRQYHNCNCCKKFIRNYGNVIAINDDLSITTLWEEGIEVDEVYSKVLSRLKTLVSNSPTVSIFVTNSINWGVDYNHAIKEGKATTYNHFFLRASLNSKYIGSPTIKSILEGRLQIGRKSLQTFSIENTQTILDLCTDNQLYRGADYIEVLQRFLSYKTTYDSLPSAKQELFTWLHFDKVAIKNTAIGSLLEDLSDGTNLEIAVVNFEKRVAPENYKRPSSVVTAKQIELMKKGLEEKGLLDSINRRQATIHDMDIKNCLFVNRDIVTKKTNDFFETLKPRSIKDLKPQQTLGISDFIETLGTSDFIEALKTTKDLQLFIDGGYKKNHVSLITALNEETPSLLKWKNQFSWSYENKLAAPSRIKDRVKKAGGTIDSPLRISLSWHNSDDLDLAIIQPGNKAIYFSEKKSFETGGQLDIDMNVCEDSTNSFNPNNPVENIFYPDLEKLIIGEYRIFITNFRKRTSSNVGYEVELELNGQQYLYTTEKSPKDRETISNLAFTVNNDGNIAVNGFNSTYTQQKDFAGIKTQTFVPVKTCCLSPDGWEDKKEAKHLFFFLHNMENVAEMRPFYNEFLRNDLKEHHKALEILAENLQVGTVLKEDKPLNGIGFMLSEKQSFYVLLDNILTLVNL